MIQYLEPVEPCVFSDAGLQRQDESIIGKPGFKEDQRGVRVNAKEQKFLWGKISLVLKNKERHA